MPHRVDSSVSVRTPLLRGQETSSSPSSPTHGGTAQPKLTRGMEGLKLRTPAERSPGPRGMAPRADAAMLGAPRAPGERPRVQFGRNRVHEADGAQHSQTIDFGPKAHPRRLPKTSEAPGAGPSSQAAPARPTAGAPRPPQPSPPASPQPSSPKGRGLLGKLFNRGGAKPGPGAATAHAAAPGRLSPGDLAHPGAAFNMQFKAFLESKADQRTKDYLGNLLLGPHMEKFRASAEELAESVEDPAARAMLPRLVSLIDAMKGDHSDVRVQMNHARPAKPSKPAAPTRPQSPVRLADPEVLAHQEAADKFSRRFNRFMEGGADPAFKERVSALFHAGQMSRVQAEFGHRMNLAGSKAEFAQMQGLLSALHGLKGDFTGIEVHYKRPASP
jgi:hypothetical protein